MRSIVMSMSVCLSVCLLAHVRNDTAKLHQFSLQVARGLVSIELRWRCDALCTSGCVDDVMFSQSGFYGASRALQLKLLLSVRPDFAQR